MLNAGQVIALLLLIGVAHSSHVDGETLIWHLVRKIDFVRGEDATASRRERQVLPPSPAYNRAIGPSSPPLKKPAALER